MPSYYARAVSFSRIPAAKKAMPRTRRRFERMEPRRLPCTTETLADSRTRARISLNRIARDVLGYSITLLLLVCKIALLQHATTSNATTYHGWPTA